MRISAEGDHRFRSKPITRFGRSRSGISLQRDHSFRAKAITHFADVDHRPAVVIA
jgi:hypothetical protein